MTTLTLDERGGTVTITISRPILARTVLEELSAVVDDLGAAGRPLPLVLASAHPTIFLAGAHLGEIAELDAAACVPYAELGRSLIRRLADHPAPVVAAVDGSCSGGGFDLVLACDVVVASPRATFSHPGVLRGLVTGWGGTAVLPTALGRQAARRALLEGADIGAHEAILAGVVTEIADDPRSKAVELAGRLHRLHPSRVPLWRLLRESRFVDRFRAVVVEKS